jgi:drug/metabolite transporter (DMT)-like permease
MSSPSENSGNSGRYRLVFVGMLVLGVAVALLSVFMSNTQLALLGILLALVGALGWLSTRQ